VIGVRSDIENVPIQRLQAYYHLYYQPDNAVLLVSGRIDPAKTLAQIETKFGAIPRPERKLPMFYTEEPPQDGERAVELRRVGDTQVVAAGYHIPAAAHPDFAAIGLLATVLTQSPGGRLYKALVETHKAAAVFADAGAMHDPGLLILGARLPNSSSLEQARTRLLSTIEQLSQSPPTAEEVERARAQDLKQMERALDQSDRFGIALSNWMAAGDWRLFFLYRDRLRAVTPADIQRVAATYLKPGNRTAGVFVPVPSPARAQIPANPDVPALVKDYKGGPARSQGEAFDPTPANIDARTQRTTVGDIKLALLPKKTRGSVVVANVQLDLGDEQSLKGLATVGALCGQMLMRGTAHHTRQQLQDEINRLKANLNVSGGPTGAVVRIETTSEHLVETLTLAAEVLREPSFPADELEILRNAQLTGLATQRTEPQALAVLAMQRHLSPYPQGDVRYTPTIDESVAAIQAVTLAQVKNFHHRFYGAAHAEVGIVGDFDAASIEPLVRKLFDGWKSPSRYARVPALYHEVGSPTQVIRTPDKPNAMFVAAENLQLRDDDPDYPALELGNYLLGGGFISSRLATRVRQKDGLSYGIGSQLSAGPLDRAGVFLVFAISAPQNTDKVQAAVSEELARALKDGFTEEEVNSARDGWLQTRTVGRSQDGTMSAVLAGHEYLGRTMAWDAALEARVRALKAEDIVAALRRHIDPARLSIFKAGDFPQAGAGHDGG
jgi:zinc protease